MFGLSEEQVNAIVENWYSKNMDRITAEIKDSIKEELKSELSGYERGTADVDFHVENILNSWIAKVDKFNQAHKDTINAAVEKKYNDIVLVVNGLLEKADLSIKESDKGHTLLKEYMDYLKAITNSLADLYSSNTLKKQMPEKKQTPRKAKLNKRGGA